MAHARIWPALGVLALLWNVSCYASPAFGQNPAAKVGASIVRIEGPITRDTSLAVLTAASTIPKTLNVIIDSPGGESEAALIIVKTFEALRKQGGRVNCIVTQQAMSAAFVVLQACSLRIGMKNSAFMIHEPMIVYRGPTPVVIKLKTLKMMTHSLQDDADSISVIVAPRLGLTTEQYAVKVADDWNMTATEALQNHAIDRITN